MLNYSSRTIVGKLRLVPKHNSYFDQNSRRINPNSMRAPFRINHTSHARAGAVRGACSNNPGLTLRLRCHPVGQSNRGKPYLQKELCSKRLNVFLSQSTAGEKQNVLITCCLYGYIVGTVLVERHVPRQGHPVHLCQLRSLRCHGLNAFIPGKGCVHCRPNQRIWNTLIVKGSRSNVHVLP